MKKSSSILIAVILTLGIAACTKPVYRQTAEQFLSTAPGKASYNVSGQWRGPEGHNYNYWRGYHHSSFGSMMLVQKGSKITGTYAEYEIIGKVNGTQLTLFGLHTNEVYYSWHFNYEPKAKMLVGKMCDGYYPKAEPHCYPLSLEKM